MDSIKFFEKLPTINQFTILLIQEAMKRADGDQGTAARMIGISKKELANKIKFSRKFIQAMAAFFILIISCNVSQAANSKGFVRNEVVVTFQQGTSQTEINDMVETYKLTIIDKMPQIHYYVMQITDNTPVSEMVSLLNKLTIVKKCEPNYVTSSMDLPNDNLFPQQWSLENNIVQGADLHMEEAWKIEEGSPSVIVAIIDMGFDVTHEDLQENIWHNPGEIPGNGIDDDHNGYVDDVIGWDFVNQAQGLDDPDCDWKNEDNDPTSKKSSHGNRVLGVLGATTGNNIGIAGIAGKCKMMLLRAGFYNVQGQAVLSSSHIAKAIIYAADNGASVINISSGSHTYSASYRAALQYAINNGVLIVCSAGNDGSNNLVYPAAYNLPGLISVGATNAQDKKSWFSNYGDWVDVSAPGQNIMSTLLDNKYGLTQGTSFSSPMVAGIAALIFSHYPDLTPAQVKDQIMNTVDIVDELNGDNLTSGRVNARRALSQAPAGDAESEDGNINGGAATAGSQQAVASPAGSSSGGGCFIAASSSSNSFTGILLAGILLLAGGCILNFKS